MREKYLPFQTELQHNSKWRPVDSIRSMISPLIKFLSPLPCHEHVAPLWAGVLLGGLLTGNGFHTLIALLQPLSIQPRSVQCKTPEVRYSELQLSSRHRWPGKPCWCFLRIPLTNLNLWSSPYGSSMLLMGPPLLFCACWLPSPGNTGPQLISVVPLDQAGSVLNEPSCSPCQT